MDKEEAKQKLRDLGRTDLLRIFEINESGFAGVSRKGGIVDRREDKYALPVAENSLLGIPKPRCTECKQESNVNDLRDSICRNCRKQVNNG